MERLRIGRDEPGTSASLKEREPGNKVEIGLSSSVGDRFGAS